jgi:glycosyltransferase involved in cell wall biosynthesis
VNTPASILLTAPYPGDRLESIERFVRCLAEGLRSHLPVEIITPRQIFGRLAPNPALSKWFGYIDRYLVFPRFLAERARGPNSIVHLCDQGDAPYSGHLGSTPHLLTCHDLLAIRAARGELPEHRVRPSGRVLQSSILRSIRRVPWVACDSNATRADIARLSPPRDGAQLRPIPIAIDPRFRPMPEEAARSIISSCGLDTDFILHVGGNQWYKNRLGVLQIYREVLPLLRRPLSLVLIGKPLSPELQRYIRATGLEGRVFSLTDRTDDDLRAFYSTAKLLLFPSLYEGFGWPIIEAQACGAPVVTSNREPMLEVGGKAAVFIDPADPAGAAAVVSRLLSDSNEAISKRIDAGFENVRRFSLESMVSGYLNFYNEIAASRNRAAGVGFAVNLLSNPDPACAA